MAGIRVCEEVPPAIGTNPHEQGRSWLRRFSLCSPAAPLLAGLLVLGLFTASSRARAERLHAAGRIDSKTMQRKSVSPLRPQVFHGKPMLCHGLTNRHTSSRVSFPEHGISLSFSLSDDDDAELIFRCAHNGWCRPVHRGNRHSPARAQRLRGSTFGARYSNARSLMSRLAPGQDGSTDPPDLSRSQSSILPASCLPRNIPESFKSLAVPKPQRTSQTLFMHVNPIPAAMDFGGSPRPVLRRDGLNMGEMLFEPLTQSEEVF